MTKRKTAFVVALVVIGVAALGLAAAVYAKYIASLQVTGNADNAAWNFESDNENAALTCTITSTVVTGTVTSGKIAPGTSGECTFALSNRTSDVAVDYTLKANETGSSTPKNLQLSSNGTTWGTLASFTKSGTLAIGATNTTVTIYWQWPYETGTVTDGIAEGDDDDTDDGEAAAAGNMTLVFDISGVQHNPANAL